MIGKTENNVTDDVENQLVAVALVAPPNPSFSRHHPETNVSDVSPIRVSDVSPRAGEDALPSKLHRTSFHSADEYCSVSALTSSSLNSGQGVACASAESTPASNAVKSSCSLSASITASSEGRQSDP
jgi:hypothetical protein